MYFSFIYTIPAQSEQAFSSRWLNVNFFIIIDFKYLKNNILLNAG